MENKEIINHPSHYGGEDNTYEAIKVIEAWKLGFNLGNVTKYISRAGRKDPSKTIEDLEKAAFYLNREINNLKEVNDKNSLIETPWECPICKETQLITESGVYHSKDNHFTNLSLDLIYRSRTLPKYTKEQVKKILYGSK